MNRAVRVISLLLIAAVIVFAAQRVRSQDAPTPSVIGLDQGWSAEQAAREHYTSQGASLMPAAWLRAIRQKNGAPFMDPSHLAHFGFMDVHARKTKANPYGWPIGLTVDRINGIEVAGFTCAACHTGELTFRGTTMRIEGGAPNFDLGRFAQELRTAILSMEKSPSARAAFVSDAVANGYPKDRISHDIDEAAARIDDWLINTSGTGGTSTVPGPGRLDAVAGIANRMFSNDLRNPNNAIRGVAPSSYPYLWDIWRFYVVQYVGNARQPMSRNMGEALGSGAVTQVVDSSGKISPASVRWKSSLRVTNLYDVEEMLATLRPPVWPASVLGAVDPAQAARGRVLFGQSCAECHGVSKISGTTPTEWAVHIVPLRKIGTDPTEAVMFAGARFDVSIFGLGKLPAVVGVAYFVTNMQQQAYRDAGITPAEQSKYDGWGRTGYATTPCGYKARPLIGVWATPPFLHNGSVPSVYDLLSETRPPHPILGNPEFDPVKLGAVQAETADTMVLDTTKLGNSNAGHWFTNDATRPGRIGPAWTDEQKYDIIAYLKVATYADYPTKWVSAPYPLPCDKDFTWANGLVPDLHVHAR